MNNRLEPYPSDDPEFYVNALHVLCSDMKMLSNTSDAVLAEILWLAHVGGCVISRGFERMDVRIIEAIREVTIAADGDVVDLAVVEKALRLAAKGELTRAGAIFREYMMTGAEHIAKERAVKNELSKFAGTRMQQFEFNETGRALKVDEARQRRSHIQLAAKDVLSARTRRITSVSEFVKSVRAEMARTGSPGILGERAMHDALSEMIRDGRLTSEMAPLLK